MILSRWGGHWQKTWDFCWLTLYFVAWCTKTRTTLNQKSVTVVFSLGLLFGHGVSTGFPTLLSLCILSLCSAFYGGCKRDTARICRWTPCAAGCPPLSIDISCPAANPPHAAAAVDSWDRRTDTGPLHIPCSTYFMRAVSIAKIQPKVHCRLKVLDATSSHVDVFRRKFFALPAWGIFATRGGFFCIGKRTTTTLKARRITGQTRHF